MKPHKIKFIGQGLKKSFDKLSNEDPIKKALTRAIKDIQKNAFCGRNVKKKLIPKKLIQKYNINNLWIYNLPSAWRMLYSLTSEEEIHLVAILLDWMDHQTYERLFKF
jgi:hypothetical protein